MLISIIYHKPITLNQKQQCGSINGCILLLYGPGCAGQARRSIIWRLVPKVSLSNISHIHIYTLSVYV